MSEQGVSDARFSAQKSAGRYESFYLGGLAVCLALLPLVGYLAPRALAFIPGLIGLIGFFAGWYIYGSRPQIHKGTLYIVVPVMGIAFLSCIWAIDPAESLERSLKMFPVLLSGVVLLSVLNSYREHIFPLFAKIFPIVVIFTLAYALIDLLSDGALHLFLRGIERDEEFNVSELNRGIIVIVLSLIPAWAMLGHHKGYWNSVRRYIYQALILILLAGVLFTTDSQSAHLIVLTCAVFWFLFPVKNRVAWFCLWVLLTVLIFVAPWLAQYMFDTMPALIGDVEWFRQSYALNRLEIWDYVGRYIEANPFYGFGIEATRSIEDFDSAFLYDDKAIVLHPHNFALQLWIEFGAIGAILASMITGYILKILMNMEPSGARLGLVAFMGLLCPAATAYGLWQGWFVGLFFMMCGYCILSQSTRQCD